MQILMTGRTLITMGDIYSLSTSTLMRLRFCDFDWHAAPPPPPYKRLILKALGEMSDRGLPLNTKVYVAKEWMSPEGACAIGIPFYLMHPKLTALELTLKGEAEGYDEREFLKLVRHELGHCFDHAYGISLRRDFISVFGSSRKTYRPEFYKADATAKEQYVEHLPGFYAQSHPLEDFAETFAVWLDPKSRWKQKYARYPIILNKLEFVEAKVRECSNLSPLKSMPLLCEAQKSVMSLALHYKRQTSLMAKIRTHATINR